MKHFFAFKRHQWLHKGSSMLRMRKLPLLFNTEASNALVRTVFQLGKHSGCCYILPTYRLEFSIFMWLSLCIAVFLVKNVSDYFEVGTELLKSIWLNFVLKSFRNWMNFCAINKTPILYYNIETALVCLPPEDGVKIYTEICYGWVIENFNLF
jgi:hypothetical protein